MQLDLNDILPFIGTIGVIITAAGVLLRLKSSTVMVSSDDWIGLQNQNVKLFKELTDTQALLQMAMREIEELKVRLDEWEEHNGD